MNRRDLLAVCVEPGTPLDVLQAKWCSKCLNPECSRSAVGTSKFEQRIGDWEEKLFKNPPRLAADDPRFAKITAQKFITIDPGRTPEIRSDWVDPRDLKEPEPSNIVTIPAAVPPSALPLEVPRTEASAPSPSNSSTSRRSDAARALVGANAPDQSGKILRGAPESPTNDPWAVPEPASSTEEVVQPGTTIKMGRSGV